MADGVQAGQGAGQAQEARRRARHAARPSSSSPIPTIFPRTEFNPETIRERLEIASYLHRGREGHASTTRRSGKKDVFHARRRHRRVPEEARRRRAGASAVHEAPFSLAKDERRAHRDRASVDRSDRREAQELRQRHPHGLRRHARERPSQRGSCKAIRNYIETHNLTPRGVTLAAEDIREGVVGVLSVFVARAAVPGPDQGPPEQPRGAGARSTARCAPRSSSGSTRTAPSPSRSSRASSSPRARARRRAPPPPQVIAQDRDERPAHAARQAQRLLSHRPRGDRAVHRRGRLRRRLRQAGPRPQRPGDPPAARQGAEHRGTRDWARCSRTRSSPTSSPRSAAASARASTSRGSATSASSCSPTPTPTATTSRRCCSRSSTGTCRS